LNPIGYKIGLELLVKCHASGLEEVPIHFADRTRGESKLSAKTDSLSEPLGTTAGFSLREMAATAALLCVMTGRF